MSQQRIDELVNALQIARRYCVSPMYSLHSYRDGEWLLVSSLHSARDMASEYMRYCLSGQWGDCLEVRCNGVRVPLP